MAKRFYHYLRPNQNSESMQNCVCVDCETVDFERPDGITEKRLVFGWAAVTRRKGNGDWARPLWKRFDHYLDWWLWLVQQVRPKERLWVWCHNSNFDYPALHVFSHPKEIGWVTKMLIIEAPPTLIKLRKDKSTIIMADTLNIWRMGLVELGEMIGKPKLEMPAEWNDRERDDAYCRRDVEIILQALTGWCYFLKDEDMGGFVPTIAGQAMRTFRHKYMTHPILIDAHDDALALARNAYKGGRVECGFIGHVQQPVFYLDVNSMYPYVMLKNEFPSKLIAYHRFISKRGVADLLRSHAVVAKVGVNTNEPVFPVVHEHKLCFPVGQFECFLSSPELEYGLERGLITDIHIAACYERRPLFKDFVTDLYAKKEQATREGRLLDADHWKLILNCLYGKFGQNGLKYHLVDQRPHPTKDISVEWDPKTGKYIFYRYFGDFVLSSTKDSEASESHPAIAAHVCAHARMVLWALIRQLAPQDYLYCDTDGIYTTQAGFDKLYDPEKQYAIGGLKLKATWNDVWIYGAKDCVLDGKRLLKGIRDKANEIDKGVFQQVRWYGLAGLARAGSLDMPLTKTITKTLRRAYGKGSVGPDGFVHPLVFPLS